MRVERISITKWRHFENVELEVPEAAPVVCLVGSNGTGKSQMLELVAASAQHIGLSEGFESGRGNPFTEASEFSVRFYIAPGTVPTLDLHDGAIPEHLKESWAAWDRTLTVGRTEAVGVTLTAGGVPAGQSEALAQHVANLTRASRSVHYLMLDADRAYPKISVPVHEMGAAFDTDWAATTKSKSFLLTKSLYEEWFRFLLGTENRENNKFIASIRIARERGLPEPPFDDKLQSYRDAVKTVLPHLLFTGIDSQARQIHFDSTGTALTFDQLSGGEREIAFLVGQIERFGLRKGLLLVDEPELHLNYDLLRSWVGFLKSTVDEGQIWLATHSLEVVEVTGQDATFLLERDEQTRKVVKCAPLASRPVISTLSRAVGSPAFSISNLTFVLIEGEDEIGERERFRALTGPLPDVRYIEAGNCREVLRKMDSLRAVATASNEPLKIGGIIDRDWRDAQERKLMSGLGLHVLAVHEIENLLLHPPTVKRVIENISGDPAIYDDALKAAADRRAGSAIWNAARTNRGFENFPPPHADVRKLAHELTWSDFADPSLQCQKIADADPQLDLAQRALIKKHLEVQTAVYGRVREGDTLWKVCEGKEVFRSLAKTIGFSDPETAERAIIGIWQLEPGLEPEELRMLRLYVEQLGKP